MSSALEANLAVASASVQNAITAAIQYAANETKEIAVRELSANVSCNSQLVRDRVFAQRVTIKRSSWSIVIKSKPIDLRHFQPIQQRDGVRVNTGSGSRFYKSAFGPNSKRLGGNAFRRKTDKRLPIQKVRGVTLTSVAQKIRLEEKLKFEFYHKARIRINRNMALVSFLGGSAKAYYGIS